MYVSGWSPLPLRAGCACGCMAAGAQAPEHTAAELADMLAVAIYENDQMNAALGQCHAWIASDPKTFGDFSGRVNAHAMAFPPIVERAQTAIHEAPGLPPGDNLPSSQSYAELIAWRTGLTALYREWAHNPHGCALPSFKDTPQPTAPDPGAAFIKETTPVAHAVDATVQTAEDAARAARDTLQSRTPWLVGGIALGVLGLFALRKAAA